MRNIDLKTLEQSWAPFSRLLRPPSSKKEYEEISDLLDQLIDAIGNDANHPLETLLNIVGNIIEEYESNYKDLDNIEEATDAVSVLKFLMQEHNLKQADLGDIFGSQSNVSEILNGKRELNLKQIKKLSNRFQISVSTFID